MQSEEIGKLVVIALVASFLTVVFTSFNVSSPGIVENTIIETVENPVKVIETEKITETETILREESAIIGVVEKVDSSVLSIMDSSEVAGGTGFFVGDGLIITNKHVVTGNFSKFVAIDNMGERHPVEVVSLDPIYDLALLRSDFDLESLELGDSDKLRVGQTVVAIGNALGELSNTVSVGVVSGLQRSIGADLRSLIQTDAAINPGNSGGPLLDVRGRVIGINTAIASRAQNIGFAIPINIASKAIDQFRATGIIEYAFLGVEYNLNNHQVLGVLGGGPAKLAGILKGDVIISIAGRELTRELSLGDVIVDLEPGGKVNVLVNRNGVDLLLEAILGRR
jgi:S1-C subfamily serine protease